MNHRLALLGVMIVAAACGTSDEDESSILLSAQGLYQDIATRTVVPEAIEYVPDYVLWSDAIQKRRWLVLPDDTQIDTSNMEHWELPVGAKLFKEFSQYGQLFETRMIERIGDSGRVERDYKLATYAWREDQTDAEDTKDGVQDIFYSDHDVPPQKVCLDCHRGEPGVALGVSALQLSRSGMLSELARRSLLTTDPERTFEIPGNEIESSALGYMHGNCGHCHSDTGQAPGSMHLRFLLQDVDAELTQSDIYKTTIHEKITEWKDHPERFEKRLIPGEPEASAIYYRMTQRGDEEPSPDQMPPLASEHEDVQGVALVRAWIQGLEDPAQSDDARETDTTLEPENENEKGDAADAHKDDAAESDRKDTDKSTGSRSSSAQNPSDISDADDPDRSSGDKADSSDTDNTQTGSSETSEEEAPEGTAGNEMSDGVESSPTGGDPDGSAPSGGEPSSDGEPTSTTPPTTDPETTGTTSEPEEPQRSPEDTPPPTDPTTSSEPGGVDTTEGPLESTPQDTNTTDTNTTDTNTTDTSTTDPNTTDTSTTDPTTQPGSTPEQPTAGAAAPPSQPPNTDPDTTTAPGGQEQPGNAAGAAAPNPPVAGMGAPPPPPPAEDDPSAPTEPTSPGPEAGASAPPTEEPSSPSEPPQAGAGGDCEAGSGGARWRKSRK